MTDSFKNKFISFLMPYRPNKIGIFGSYARGEAKKTAI